MIEDITSVGLMKTKLIIYLTCPSKRNGMRRDACGIPNGEASGYKICITPKKEHYFNTIKMDAMLLSIHCGDNKTTKNMFSYPTKAVM